MKWTEKEVEFLKKNYMFMTDREIAEVLNRPRGSVINKRRELGLRKFPKYIKRIVEEVLE